MVAMATPGHPEEPPLVRRQCRGRPSAETIEHAGSTQTSETEGPTREEGQKQYQSKNPCRRRLERGFMVETDES